MVVYPNPIKQNQRGKPYGNQSNINAIIVENGEANINEIFYAIGNWSKQIGPEVYKGVIENYQKEMVKMLCL